MRPTLDQLRHLVMLDQTRNFSVAARACHISQPPLSRSIRKLEDVVGQRLVERERGAVAFTRAGEAFVERAREAINTIDQAVLAARNQSDEATRIRVGVNEYVYWLLRPAGLVDFAKKLPNVTLEPVDRPELPASKSIRSGQVDMCFEVTGSRETGGCQNGMQSQLILCEPLAIMMQDSGPLAQYETVALSDLIDQPLAVFARQDAPQIYDDMVQVFAANEIAPRIALEASLLETVVNAVQVNGVLGVVPASVGRGPFPHLRVIPLSGTSIPKVFLFLAWRRASNCRAYREFVAWTRERCRTMLGSRDMV